MLVPVQRACTGCARGCSVVEGEDHQDHGGDPAPHIRDPPEGPACLVLAIRLGHRSKKH